MACFRLFIALGGRSETIRGLRGDGRDERFAQIDLRATAAAGVVVLRWRGSPGAAHLARLTWRAAGCRELTR